MVGVAKRQGSGLWFRLSRVRFPSSTPLRTVAQLVERQTENLGSAGSTPAGSTIWVSRLVAMAADCKSAGFTIVGSSLTWPTTFIFVCDSFTLGAHNTVNLINLFRQQIKLHTYFSTLGVRVLKVYTFVTHLGLRGLIIQTVSKIS